MKIAKYIYNYKKTILSVFLAILGVFFITDISLGADYYDYYKFYKQNNRYYVEFKVKTTFETWTIGWLNASGGQDNSLFSGGNLQNLLNASSPIDLGEEYSKDYVNCSPYTYDSFYAHKYRFEAGKTYKFEINSPDCGYWWGTCQLHIYNQYNHCKKDISINEGDYLVSNPDGIIAYLQIYPSINITYPLDGAEIAGFFDIQGISEVPTSTNLTRIVFLFYYQDGQELKYKQFYKDLDYGINNFTIPVSGLPANDYFITYYFVNPDDESQFYVPPENSISITLTTDLPIVISGETYPSSGIMIFENPTDYYYNHSYYSTPTDLFISLASGTEAIFSFIGDTLGFFYQIFDIKKAKEWGQEAGKSIADFKVYLKNIDYIFNDMPLYEFSIFILTLYIAVFVIKIIKLLIEYFKPF